MTNYVKKEERILNKIMNTMDKLDGTLEKMDKTDSKVKEYFEQKRAIHEIRVIISKAKKVARVENRAIEIAEDDVIYETEEEFEIAKEIDNEFDKLEKNLNSYEETDNKVKSYLKQKEALHEARKILKKAEKL